MAGKEESKPSRLSNKKLEKGGKKTTTGSWWRGTESKWYQK